MSSIIPHFTYISLVIDRGSFKRWWLYLNFAHHPCPYPVNIFVTVRLSLPPFFSVLARPLTPFPSFVKTIQPLHGLVVFSRPTATQQLVIHCDSTPKVTTSKQTRCRTFNEKKGYLDGKV